MTKSMIGGLLIGVTLLAAIIWLITGFDNLSRRIMPGASMSPSSSMKPYEISLRTAHPIGWDRDVDTSDKIYEWKLAVPRAFVFDEVGSNGAIDNYKDAKNNQYFPKLRGELDSDMKTLKPFPLGKRKYGEQHMSMHLRNSRTSFWEAKYNSCIPQHLVATVAEQYDFDASSIKCREASKLCSVAMQIDGWFVEAFVTKKLYAQPELVCEVTKDFLQQYTVKRDDLRQKRSESN